MEFKEMNIALQMHFAEMVKDVTHLFEVAVDKDDMWNTYLDSFPAGKNEIYRIRREYDCGCCRHFIKMIGNAVVIKDQKIHTIWDLKLDDKTFQPVVDAMAKYIRSHVVGDIFISKGKNIGTCFSHEQRDGGIVRYDHFFLSLPDKLVDKSVRSEGDIKGEFRDIKKVFKSSLDEISEDSILTVLELISQNSLYKGEEWKYAIHQFLRYKKEYDILSSNYDKELYAWEKSISAGAVIGKIKNHSIGTLLLNISCGMNLDAAVRQYENIVAPSNYKRTTMLYTKKMYDDAVNKIIELGYKEALSRRYAMIDDISINNVLFSNIDSAKKMSGYNDILFEMEKEAVINPKKFSGVGEVTITDFVNNILPDANKVELYLENRLNSNMVSLIAPVDPKSKTMFKWNNGFSWAYTGNMTDSMIKERVKAAGGNVDGVLRFSIQWNDESEFDQNDLDAHCIEPNGSHIFFGEYKKPQKSSIGGQLDVDVINPCSGIPAVENITWSDRSRMIPGVYKFYVNQYTNRGGRGGFRAEIEFDGQIYSFNYSKMLRQDENVIVAEVTLHKDGTFSIKEMLPSNVLSKEIWNLHTNQFIPVSMVCYSPNYWDEQNGIGNRHYFFMLQDCVNSEGPNGFYNEFLKQELFEHKKFFEALGAKCHVDNTGDQLSGVGFSSTKRNYVLLKVIGSTERVIKVTF